MSIFDKIEEIRNEPEHVRLRWAWGLTAGSMVIIVILWFILLKGQAGDFTTQSLQTDGNLSDQFNQEKKSIKDAVGQIKGSLDNANSTLYSNSESENIQKDLGVSDKNEGFSPDLNPNTDDSDSSSN